MKMKIIRGKIAEITVSDSHPDLRWLKFEGDERLFSLWNSVNGGRSKLAVGQLVEFQAEEVEGRNFFKITKIKPVARKNEAEAEVKAKSKDLHKPKTEAGGLGFSKTEVGLMISVAVKAAAAMSKEAKVSELIDRAEAIYAYLKAKRLSEVGAVAETEAEAEVEEE